MRRRKKNSYAKPDTYTRAAKDAGYAARSVYKLTEIQRRFPIFKQGQKVLDLGCSPGSWSRYAQQVVGRRGVVVGVDIEPPRDPVGTVIVESIYDLSAAQLREALGGHADVVMSDMAPRTTGNTLGDHVRQIELAQRSLDIGLELLVPGGTFITKVFDGEDAHAFVQGARPHFTKTRRLKPKAVRRESREFFMLCLGFKGRNEG